MSRDNWGHAKLREMAAKVGSGATPKGGKETYHSAGIPLIRSQNVRFEGFLDMGLAFLDEKQAAELENVRVMPRDVLLNITGASIGRVTVAPSHMDGARVNQHVTIIRPTEILDSSFLRWFLASPSQQGVIFSIQAGVTRQALTKEMILNFDVPLPPINEQHRIVSKIDELFSDLDAGVATLERAKAKLKRYRAAVLKAAVEGKLTGEWRKKNRPKESGRQLLDRILRERRRKWEEEQLAAYAKAGRKPLANWKEKYKEPAGPDDASLPALPEDWCWATVEQVSEVQGGIQKQPKRAPARNAYPFLRVANVYRNRLDLSEVHQIELFGDELARLRLASGDLLVVEGNGSITEIGRSALWLGGIKDCVHQNHIIRVRFLAGSPKYLNGYWNSPFGNNRVMQAAASTSGLYTLSVTKVCSLPIPLPPLAEQEKIAEEVERTLSVVQEADSQINADLKRSVRLRQSILKRAFDGKLVPQDPKDEPATKLLERIRAEKPDTNGKSKRARKTQ